MAKKVYALYRTDNWHTYDSRELLVVAGSIRRCCKVAKDDGATKEQIDSCWGEYYEDSDELIKVALEENGIKLKETA